MNYITLHVLPDESPWTNDQFIEKMEEKSNQAASVSSYGQRHSVMYLTQTRI